PVDPARLPGHLLLLPEGLLALLLRRSTRLRGREADRPPPLQDGDCVPVHPPEPPPLLPVPGVLPAVLPLGGHRSGACPGRPAPARARWADHGRQRHAAAGLLTVLPLAPASRRRPARLLLVHAPSAGPLHPLAAAHLAEPAPHGVGLGEPPVRDADRRLHPAARARGHRRPSHPPVSETPERYPHDVLVVGAGGAGLRAAIEAAAMGASVGLVCKSLLGKAHTVMAEGGVAAA